MSVRWSRGWFVLNVAAVLAALPGCFAATCSRVPDEICSNGFDDDEDGLIDCADADCLEAPVCVAPGCRDATCMPGEIACDPATGFVEQCNDAGDTLCFVGSCDGRNCVGGQCTPIDCIEGWTRCVDEGRAVQLCAAGIWIEPVLCDEGELCLDVNGVEQCSGGKCEPGEIFCIDNDTVGICSMDGAVAILNECEDGSQCVAGACFPVSCPTAQACAWYVLDLDNTSISDPLPLTVSVVNPSAVPMSWAAQILSGGAWMNVLSGMVDAGDLDNVLLPDRHVEGSAIDSAGAYRIVTNVPGSVYVRNGLEAGSFSASMTAVRSEAELGTEYIVVTEPTAMTFETHPGGFAVVATSPGTSVTFLVTDSIVGGNGIPWLSPLESHTVILDDADVLQIVGNGQGADLTGSRITASAPVIVYAFNACAVTSPGECDQVGEVMPPTSSLGLEHYVPVNESTTSLRIAANGPAWVEIEWTPGVATTFMNVVVDFGIPAEIPLSAAGDREIVRVLADAPILVGVVDGGNDPALTVVRPVSGWFFRERFVSSANASTLSVLRIGVGDVWAGMVLLDDWLMGPGASASATTLPEGAFLLDSADTVPVWGRIISGFPPAVVAYDIQAGGW